MADEKHRDDVTIDTPKTTSNRTSTMSNKNTNVQWFSVSVKPTTGPMVLTSTSKKTCRPTRRRTIGASGRDIINVLVRSPNFRSHGDDEERKTPIKDSEEQPHPLKQQTVPHFSMSEPQILPTEAPPTAPVRVPTPKPRRRQTIDGVPEAGRLKSKCSVSKDSNLTMAKQNSQPVPIPIPIGRSVLFTATSLCYMCSLQSPSTPSGNTRQINERSYSISKERASPPQTNEHSHSTSNEGASPQISQHSQKIFVSTVRPVQSADSQTKWSQKSVAVEVEKGRHQGLEDLDLVLSKSTQEIAKKIATPVENHEALEIVKTRETEDSSRQGTSTMTVPVQIVDSETKRSQNPEVVEKGRHNVAEDDQLDQNISAPKSTNEVVQVENGIDLENVEAVKIQECSTCHHTDTPVAQKDNHSAAGDNEVFDKKIDEEKKDYRNIWLMWKKKAAQRTSDNKDSGTKAEKSSVAGKVQRTSDEKKTGTKEEETSVFGESRRILHGENKIKADNRTYDAYVKDDRCSKDRVSVESFKKDYLEKEETDVDLESRTHSNIIINREIHTNQIPYQDGFESMTSSMGDVQGEANTGYAINTIKRPEKSDEPKGEEDLIGTVSNTRTNTSDNENTHLVSTANRGKIIGKDFEENFNVARPLNTDAHDQSVQLSFTPISQNGNNKRSDCKNEVFWSDDNDYNIRLGDGFDENNNRSPHLADASEQEQDLNYASGETHVHQEHRSKMDKKNQTQKQRQKHVTNANKDESTGEDILDIETENSDFHKLVKSMKQSQEIVGRLQTNALKQNETIAELQSKLNGHRQTHSQSQDNHKIAELQRKNNELKSQVCDFKISLDHAKNKERAAVERAKQMEKEIRTQKEEMRALKDAYDKQTRLIERMKEEKQQMKLEAKSMQYHQQEQQQ